MIKTIKKLLAAIWNSLKKIFKAIVNFVKDIANWLKQKFYRIVKKYPNAKPIALRIKKDLEEGNYNTYDLGLKDVIVKTFYDEETGKIIEEETEVVKYNELDEKTKEKFGDKELIVFS